MTFRLTRYTSHITSRCIPNIQSSQNVLKTTQRKHRRRYATSSSRPRFVGALKQAERIQPANYRHRTLCRHFGGTRPRWSRMLFQQAEKERTASTVSMDNTACMRSELTGTCVLANDATNTIARTGIDRSNVEGLFGDRERCTPKCEADRRERIAWTCAVSVR